MHPTTTLLQRSLVCALCLALWSTPGRAEDLLSSQMVDEARMWQSKGRWDLASDTWRRLLITNPQHAEALVSLAKIQLQSGQLAQAEALLARAARLPKKPSAYAQVAAALQAAKSRSEPPSGTPQAPTKGVPAAPPAGPVVPPPAPVAAPPGPAPRSPAPKASAGAGAPTPSKSPAPSRPAAPSAAQAGSPRQPAPPPAPVPPPSTEVQITPIPFRTVEARDTPPPDAPDPRADGVQLRGANQLLLGGATSPGTAAPRTNDAPAKTSPKNKPRPFRPAPALSPPLSE